MSIILGSAPTVHFDQTQFESDGAFLVEIVGLFLNTCPELLSALENAVSRKDAQRLRRTAHSLGGAVSIFGAESVVEQIRMLEIMGKNGNLSGVDEAWRGVRRLMSELLSEMQAIPNQAIEK